jgi:dihydrofolate reductase
MSKVVFSRRLETVDWNNTRLIRENAGHEIRNMKMRPGKDLAIFGSANLISTVMDEVDEHRVMVNPILLGGGVPLFKNAPGRTRLELVSDRVFRTGNILLCYQPVKE